MESLFLWNKNPNHRLIVSLKLHYKAFTAKLSTKISSELKDGFVIQYYQLEESIINVIVIAIAYQTEVFVDTDVVCMQYPQIPLS